VTTPSDLDSHLHAAGFTWVEEQKLVREELTVLAEVDGPTLCRGTQDLNGWGVELPEVVAERPNRDLLEQGYRGVRNAS
jgi:hypothetical protein